MSRLDTIIRMYSAVSRASLVHPTSLPGEYGIGDLGPEAYRFADFLRDSAGQHHLADAASGSHRRDQLSVPVLFFFRRSAPADQPGTSEG